MMIIDESTVRQFIGWLSADIPALHRVEVPVLNDSWNRFKCCGTPTTVVAEPLPTQADPPSPITLTVSPIHAGEENDGPLESTDLFVKGPDISLLINICVGNTLTYSGTLSGKKRYGTIHPPSPTKADPPETLIARLRAFAAYPGAPIVWMSDAADLLAHHAAEITRLTQERDHWRGEADQTHQEAAHIEHALREQLTAAERRERTAFEAGWHDGIDYGCGDQTYADVNARFTAYQAHAQTEGK